MKEEIKKIEQMIILLEEIQTDEMNNNIVNRKDSIKGKIKDLEHQHSLYITNDPLKAVQIKNEIETLQLMLMWLNQYKRSKYQLVEALDSFMCTQSEFYPNLDFNYKMSFLDLHHPIRNWHTLNKSISIIKDFFNHLNIDQTVQFLNQYCNLRGHKRVQAQHDSFSSKDCCDIGLILQAALNNGGFWLVKRALHDSDFVDKKIIPIKLLNILVAFYNRRNMSLADIKKGK